MGDSDMDMDLDMDMDIDSDMDIDEVTLEPDEFTEDELDIPPETETPVPKEGEFRPGVVVPPGDVIYHYSFLLLHFKQSEALHQSFSEAFRIFPLRSKCNDTDSLASADIWLDFLDSLESDPVQCRQIHGGHYNKFQSSPSIKFQYLYEYVDGFTTDRLSRMMLFQIFVNHASGLSQPSDIDAYAEGMLASLKSLRPTPKRPETPPLQLPDSDLVTAFSAAYRDRHGLVRHYSNELRANMDAWINDSTRSKYNAPYTSLVNSSMMGKSRFEKQLSEYDPVIYFCLREDNDTGYPPSTNKWAKRRIQNPCHLTRFFGQRSSAWIEELGLLGHLYFFAGLLENILQVVVESGEKDKKRLRTFLWYLFAEPGVTRKSFGDTSKQAAEFWSRVMKDVRAVDVATLVHDRQKDVRTVDVDVATLASDKQNRKIPLDRIEVASKGLVKALCDSNDPSQQVIFLVFDEARLITLVNLDNNPAINSESRTSRFRLLRRSLRIIGEKGIRIFSIMTDTSSRLTNFQPHNDSASSRRPIKNAPGPLMFRPIIVMPTVDLGAHDLKATCDPQEVQKPERLLLFGRVSWSVMKESNYMDDLLDLAFSKLMRCDFRYLGAMYKDSSDMHNTNVQRGRRFLACLGPRLALQVGSYCQDARELVASHMMSLEYVGHDHVELLTRYLSEPILAEASARVTGENGWARPLDYLTYKLQHGVVESGFRGEFVTKVILCLAMEDAQRHLAEKRVSELSEKLESRGKGETEATTDEPTTTAPPKKGTAAEALWKYSTPVPLQSFLNALFRRPSDKRKLENDGALLPAEDKHPTPDASFVSQCLLPSLKNASTRDEDTKHLKSIKVDTLLEGTVFFNHWIRTDQTLRPSVLVKAWNRCAALMCKEGATGIDFVIPVMMRSSHLQPEATSLGKCTGPKWTTEQERASSRLISYILIQTKNRKSTSSPMRMSAMIDCVPLGKTLNAKPNFLDHNPQNPFISVLFEFRAKKPRKRESVEILWTRAAISQKVNGHKVALDKAKAGVATSDRARIKKEQAIERAEKDLHASTAHYNLAKFQVPLVAYGLDESAFKCLETRPLLKAKLNDLLIMTTEPLDRVEGAVKLELLESRACVFGDGGRNDSDVEDE
jgi:hypothetical protein